MAVRTNYADVNSIMDGITVSEADVVKYITSANVLVNDVLGTGTSDMLTEIEKWLTAHMIAISRERMAKKEEAGGAKIEYLGLAGAGLNSTPYGQMVMELDTTGAFANLAKKKAYIKAIESFD